MLVLIDSNYSFVLENLFVVGPNLTQVIGHHERGRPHRPHSHLSLALLVGQTEASNSQHIRVEEVSRSYSKGTIKFLSLVINFYTVVFHELLVMLSVKVYNTANTFPTIINIMVVSESVAGLGYGLIIRVHHMVKLGQRPFATEQDLAT